jgi:hypothetical protein
MDRRRPEIRIGARLSRRRGEAVSAAIQRADDDTASRDAVRIEARCIRQTGPRSCLMDHRRPEIRIGARLARRRGEAVSAAIQQADDDTASRDAVRIEARCIRQTGPSSLAWEHGTSRYRSSGSTRWCARVLRGVESLAPIRVAYERA